MPHSDAATAGPFVPDGHFHSPVIDPQETLRRAPLLYSHVQPGTDGINLFPEDQRPALEALFAHYSDDLFPEHPTPGRRYYWRNEFFPFGDALALDAFVRGMTPRRIVEVGSGFSSAVMLDACDDLRAEGRPVPQLDFIEPNPQRLHGLLREGDRNHCRIWECEVQDVEAARFEELGDGDLLFIDSSHVVKPANDLWHLFFNVLPRLAVGVHVFVHDIPGRFEYPEDWIREGRSWNEAYLLRAFLQFNDAFAIRYKPAFALDHFKAECRPRLPMAFEQPGTGIWIQRVG